MTKKHNVLLLGLGYHARRIHVPVLKRLSNRATLACVVDLDQERSLVEQYLKDQDLTPDIVFLDDKTKNSKKEWKKILNGLVVKHKIDSVFIATEPLSHYEYIIWALEKGLHILLDKPISTSEQIANSIKIARKNLSEYQEIEKKYKKILTNKNLIFTILAQRRFHPAYDIARKAIAEVFERTNCPITMQTSLHCDGQWRFPDEIIEQNYHPYNSGYGKLSHSGYHSVDVLAEFTDITHKNDKTINEMEIFAECSKPSDFIAQLNIEDHKKLFKGNDASFKYRNRYKKLVRSFGEIDVTANIAFKQDGQVITLGTLNLAHTGYGQRDWATAQGRDLYKGNGRVRQEQHIVEQGPFQSVFINSYQSKELLDENNNSFDVGGENHLEVIIFRNNKLFPEWKAVEKVNVKNIMNFNLDGYSRGHQEEARRICIESFFDYMDKNVSIEKQKSNFLSHKKTAVIFSGIYQSISAKKSLFGKRIVTLKYNA